MPLPSFRWLKIGVKAMCIGIMGLVLLSAHEAKHKLTLCLEKPEDWLYSSAKDYFTERK